MQLLRVVLCMRVVKNVCMKDNVQRIYSRGPEISCAIVRNHGIEMYKSGNPQEEVESRSQTPRVRSGNETKIEITF